ncbi:hypothetical protein [Streptomyces phaeochromogenes]|nr:hypothetical protein OG437_49995 [Streptomyces phaeochromogenes]
MDAGWAIYGTLLIVGAFLVFDPRKGTRPVIILILAVFAGVGVSLAGSAPAAGTRLFDAARPPRELAPSFS